MANLPEYNGTLFNDSNGVLGIPGGAYSVIFGEAHWIADPTAFTAVFGSATPEGPPNWIGGEDGIDVGFTIGGNSGIRQDSAGRHFLVTNFNKYAINSPNTVKSYQFNDATPATSRLLGWIPSGPVITTSGETIDPQTYSINLGFDWNATASKGVYPLQNNLSELLPANFNPSELLGGESGVAGPVVPYFWSIFENDYLQIAIYDVTPESTPDSTSPRSVTGASISFAAANRNSTPTIPSFTLATGTPGSIQDGSPTSVFGGRFPFYLAALPQQITASGQFTFSVSLTVEDNAGTTRTFDVDPEIVVGENEGGGGGGPDLDPVTAGY